MGQEEGSLISQKLTAISDLRDSRTSNLKLSPGYVRYSHFFLVPFEIKFLRNGG